MSLEDFSLQTFAPHVGSVFHLSSGLHEVGLTLASAKPFHVDPGTGGQSGGRAPFTLTFTGPSDPVWRQGTYQVTHEVLGEFPLFVVPLGPEAGAMRYEAVFG